MNCAPEHEEAVHTALHTPVQTPVSWHTLPGSRALSEEQRKTSWSCILRVVGVFLQSWAFFFGAGCWAGANPDKQGTRGRLREAPLARIAYKSKHRALNSKDALHTNAHNDTDTLHMKHYIIRTLYSFTLTGQFKAREHGQFSGHYRDLGIFHAYKGMILPAILLLATLRMQLQSGIFPFQY